MPNHSGKQRHTEQVFITLILVFPLLISCTGEFSHVPSRRPVNDMALKPQSGGQLVMVTGGRFTMGASNGLPDETPHEVSVDSFYMDTHPVSQRLFESVLEFNPSKRTGPENPVERVQWTDAVRFCNKCSELDGLTPCYDPETWECDFAANGYRLPTEAEWEYACRAGSQTPYFFGGNDSQLSSYAWFKPHSRGRCWPVGQKKPNPWGLYDMHGNVWEWCNDYYSETYYAESDQDNPRGPATGKKRVLRGGAWSSTAEMCRAASRFSEYQVFADACFGSDSYGFRRVKNDRAKSESSSLLVDIDNRETDESTVKHQSPPPLTDRLEPPPSPLGKIDTTRLKGTIIFAGERDGSLDIWQMNADGQEQQKLTDDSHADADPRFSPDGSQVLYTSLRDGFPQVWTMNADGSDSRHVAEGSQGQWSPDGQSIIFIRDDQAYIRELASENETIVTPRDWRRCGVPTWSPDGNQVAVASRHLENIGIFLLDIHGTKYQQLKTEDPCCSPQWSIDGDMMVFQTDKGHIHLYYTDDQTEEQVTFGADMQHDARFSPDGSMIVYCRAPSTDGPWQIWITDLLSDELDSIQITTEGSNRLPDWNR